MRLKQGSGDIIELELLGDKAFGNRELHWQQRITANAPLRMGCSSSKKKRHSHKLMIINDLMINDHLTQALTQSHILIQILPFEGGFKSSIYTRLEKESVMSMSVIHDMTPLITH